MSSSDSNPTNTPALKDTPVLDKEHPALATAAADVAPGSAQAKLQDLEAEAKDSDKSSDKEQVEGTHADPTKTRDSTGTDADSTGTDADEINLMEPPKPPR
ncbi:hypothetical protein DFH09DRAFT_1357636 [Mycena vulgaris]|nr:hypothetical protein DFH09DRAFT_1357636 [Mycena vulgaris]